jgi:hypothetical protein
MSLKGGRRNEEDGPDSHPPQQGKGSTGRDARRHIWETYGTNKTIDKVWQHYYWLHLGGNVERWCRQCHTCAASRGPRTKIRGLMHLYNVGAPPDKEQLMADYSQPCGTNVLHPLHLPAPESGQQPDKGPL